ncbi:ABC transporter ATP-binding protein [Halovulum sp. GXIMD14794]
MDDQTPMNDVILDVRDLSMHFPVRAGMFGKNHAVVRAVDNVSFDVRRGETFGIVGESGSGKTTLGRCIMRILGPTGGEIAYASEGAGQVDLASVDDSQMRDLWREIRMIFQDPQSSLNPRLPVIELVGQVLRKAEGLKGGALADRVAELLKSVGLRPEILHRYPAAFSGGQRQRIGIARALATRPQLVIADEAVSALDVSIQAQTLNLLQDLQEEFGLTYVFIAHDLAVVEHICDRVAVMFLGEIVELADTETLFASPKHPYTRALLSAVPVPDPRKRTDRRLRAAAPAEVTDTASACKFAARCPHAQDLCRRQRPQKRVVDGAEVLCHFAGEI